MKHVKLFENFGQQTLPPADLVEQGETAMIFAINDDVNVTLLPTHQAEHFISFIKIFEPAEIMKTTTNQGIGYAVYTDSSGFSFEGVDFEPKTSDIEYWITGEDTKGLNPNSDGSNGDSVYVLKRGMVITASPQGHSGPRISIADIDYFLGKLEGLTPDSF